MLFGSHTLINPFDTVTSASDLGDDQTISSEALAPCLPSSSLGGKQKNGSLDGFPIATSADDVLKAFPLLGQSSTAGVKTNQFSELEELDPRPTDNSHPSESDALISSCKVPSPVVHGRVEQSAEVDSTTGWVHEAPAILAPSKAFRSDEVRFSVGEEEASLVSGPAPSVAESFPATALTTTFSSTALMASSGGGSGITASQVEAPKFKSALLQSMLSNKGRFRGNAQAAVEDLR
ncbi:unnamed protein product [Protopolystoma xenopodis]|uniref:Uncharacterized protein n=1 Tax=Protopolystoma xenopodis TaxID=117903 RepID=A0A448XAZ5_9PLAT|nr:unnamed protein product [Protopolystoma xenopodis]